MAIIKIEPYIIDTTGDFTFNTVNATGNLSSLNANLGNTATANFFIGSGNNLSNIQGANVTGQAGNALVAGTVYTNAQPNITSVGTLTGLTSTGTVNLTGASNVALGPVANVQITGGSNGQYLQTDGSGILTWSTVSSGSSSNISNGNSNVNIPAANGNINFTAVGNTTMVVTGTGANISGTANVTGNLTAGNIIAGNGSGGNITNANVISSNTFIALTSANFTSASNVNLGTVGNIKITGGTNAYVLSTDGTGNLSWVAQSGGGGGSNISNGNSNVNIPTENGNINFSAVGNANVVVITGTGANISGTANITGNLTAGNIIAGNGSGGNITNANVISANTITALGNLNGTELNLSGNGVFGGNLTVNGTLTYINSTTLSISDPIINLQTGPNGAAPVANTGKDVGTALNYYDTTAKIAWMGWDVSNAEIAFGSNVSISSEVVTFTSLANIRSGNAQLGNNVSANFFTGNGIYLTGITTASISNGNSNINIPSANGNINFTAVGNTTMVVTGTGVNVAGTLNVTGNATLGNIITSGSGGNIINVNVISANTFTASGNISAGNANLGNVVTANFFIGAGNNLSNISGSNVSGQVGNSLVASTVYTNAQPNITSVGTLTSLAVTGNISAGNADLGNVVTANFFIGNFYGTANSATTAGTVTTAAQPNITSVGSLTGLTVSNATGVVDFTTTANVTLGTVANLHIAGGTNGYVLSTDGSGTLSWVAQSGGGGGGSNISNGNSNVNIPTSNGNINFSAVGNANVVVVTGTGVNVAGTLNVTGQSNLGAVGNVVITGGTANYVLKTDGAGNLDWVAQSGGNAANVTVDNFTGNGVQTIFTLSTTPIGINQTSVNYNGATVLRTDYTLANANITFSSAPANGSYIEVTTINLTAGGGGGASSAAAVGYSLIFGG